MKRFFLSPFAAILAVSFSVIGATVHFAFALPFEAVIPWMTDTFGVTAQTLFSLCFVMLTIGVAAFNKAKINSFLEGVVSRRIDRYVIRGV